MGLRFWIVFVGVQLIALALLTPRIPVPMRIAAGVMLLPGSALLLIGGHSISGVVMRNVFTEVMGVVMFFGFNACGWYVAARAIQHRSRKTAQ